MAITQGQNANASDFINESERDGTAANDAGRVPKLEGNGKLSGKFLDANLASGTSSPVSLTTDGTEKVVVLVKGTLSYSPGDDVDITISVAYDAVTKDSVHVKNENDNLSMKSPFMLMYTETPANQTADITVSTTAGTLGDLQIIVLKL